MRITSQYLGKSTGLAYKWMQNNNSAGNNSINSLWNNFAQTNSASNDMFSLAAQFGNLRASNTLIKAQYGNNNSKLNDILSSLNNKEEASKDQAAAAKKLEESADDLGNSAVKLSQNGRKSLLNADEEGNYNMEAIASAVNEFVDNYNATKKAVVDSGNSRAIQTAVSMVENTAVNEKMLNKVGITINSDNSLSLNKETLKGAEMSDIKSLFSGTSSYMYTVAKQASQIEGYAAADARLGGLSGYNSGKGSNVDTYA